MKKSNPELIDLFHEHKRDIMISLNCHAVGIIKKFDPSNQTAQVSISYEKEVLEPDQAGRLVPVAKAYPILADVPVVINSGGTAGITMPIKSGDSCLILFNDRDIDNWFINGESGPPNSARLHSFSDAIAIVGLRSTKQSIAGYDPENPVVFNGTTKVTVKTSKVRIENAQFQLGAVLGELVDALVSLTTTNTVPGNPAAVNPATITQLNLIKTKLQGLLE